MLLPRKEREVQDAIGLRFRMVLVTERRERRDRRVNGPDRARPESTPKLFLVQPGMNLPPRPARRSPRGPRPTPQAPQPPKRSNLIQMPSRGVANPNYRRKLTLHAASAAARLARLGYTVLSLLRLR